MQYAGPACLDAALDEAEWAHLQKLHLPWIEYESEKVHLKWLSYQFEFGLKWYC